MRTDGSTAPTAPSGGLRSGYGRIAALVMGDLIAFAVFATLGRDTHHEATGFDAIGQTLWTALPFALGWFLVAPWLGAFRRAGAERPLADTAKDRDRVAGVVAGRAVAALGFHP